MPSGSDLQGSIDKTREAFRRASAEDTDDRRLRPIAVHEDQPVAAPAARGHDVGQMHPFLQGLLDALPEPGADWPVAKREQWLETARSIFALMYDDKTDAPPPPRSQPVDFAAHGETRFGQQSA
jgi:hypothetical protein